MSNIEDDAKVLKNYLKELDDLFSRTHINNTKERNAIRNILSEREQDKARIKELEEENKRKDMFLQMAKEVIENSILKQKVKDIAKQILEEYNKVQEQFDCIWNKKSKDNYDRYKLQELSAMQQELGFILGKFEELLEEGE